MEENQNQGQDGNINNNNSSPRSNSTERSEPVRSRWTPKPEQILILESIFNSGMVNPPKDETVRIRKLLENFGSVGDANVFYWFQNRRSRSRRRQRQMQASLAEEQQRNIIHHQQQQAQSSNIQYDPLLNSSSSIGGFLLDSSSSSLINNSSVSVSPSSYLVGPGPSSSNSNCSSSSGGNNNNNNIGHHGDGVADNLFSIPLQMGFQEIEPISSILCSSDTSNLHYQTGFITVFINGVPTEVPRGLLDIKAMFGQDVLLVHSSGVTVPTNEFGFLMQTLQHGESYFLVNIC